MPLCEGCDCTLQPAFTPPMRSDHSEDQAASGCVSLVLLHPCRSAFCMHLHLALTCISLLRNSSNLNARQKHYLKYVLHLFELLTKAQFNGNHNVKQQGSIKECKRRKSTGQQLQKVLRYMLWPQCICIKCAKYISYFYVMQTVHFNAFFIIVSLVLTS